MKTWKREISPMGLMRKPLRWTYGKLGRRYPRLALVAQFQLGHIVVLGGVGLLSLYQALSTRQLVAIVVFSQAVVLIENAIGLRVAFRLLAPADPWLRGQRDQRTSVAAWQALAGLPVRFLRNRSRMALALNLVPVALFITLELGLPWYGFLILLAGAGVVLAYGIILRFFIMELIMRPVLERVSGDLPLGVDIGAVRMPLGIKLLATLPVINVITGVIVSGLSHPGQAHLSNLGVDILVTLAVAFTISFELTVLLSRSILEPIHDLGEATERVKAGDYDVRVPVISTDETGELAASFNEMVVGLGERERLHEAFAAFVDPALADRVIEEGAHLAGEDVEVTVLFVDIRGFTAFAERSSASEVVRRLNGFYERIVPILIRRGGHANKFVGDGLLGVFGAPDRRPDHADCAVGAALEIVEIVRRAYGEELRIGIGVSSGPVMAGTIGGGGRLEFTVIGDTVNTASRVEAVTRQTGDELLITEATRCLLERDHGGWEPRPTVQLKGKAERVQLYAPRALLPAAAEVGEVDQARVEADAARTEVGLGGAG